MIKPKYLKIILQLILGLTFLLNSTSVFSSIDSLKTLIDNYPHDDSVKVRYLEKLGNKYNTYGFYIESLETARLALKVSTVSGFKKGKQVAYVSIAQNLRILGKHKESAEMLDSCLKICNGSNLFDKKVKLYVILTLGAVYLETGDYPKALEAFIQSQKIERELGSGADMARSYNGLGIVYFYLGNLAYERGDTGLSKKDYQLALKYQKECLKITQNLNYTQEIVGAYTNIGLVYSSMKNYDEALKYYQLALEECQKNNYTGTLADIYDNLGGIFYEKREYIKALEYNFKAFEIKQQFEIATLYITNTNIGKTYRKLGEEDSAIVYLEKGLISAKTIGAKNTVLETTDFLHKLYFEKGKNQGYIKREKSYEKAYGYLLLYSTYKDSILNEKTNKQIEELKIQYETEKKDLKLVIQEDEIRNKSYQLYGLIILLFLIIVVSYLLYNRMILSREKVRIVLEQKLLRSQMNPHFISNALSAIQAIVYNKPPELISRYIAHFSGLMSQILEGSKEEFIPLDEDITALKNYIELQKLRFNNGFICNFSVDENIETEMIIIPPMLVQPFIENAIEHGVNHINGGGLIDISYTTEENYLIVRISDNGSGNKDNNSIKKEHKSSSTAITQSRLKNLNKGRKLKFSLEILYDTETNVEGTTVLIRIPTNH